MVKIRSLPKYRYVVSNADVEQPDVSACRMILMWTHGQYFSTERVFLIEMRYIFSLTITYYYKADNT
ncbi:hypothetical protein HanXRQr2_Chr16g0726871 [Helianthus annuus]|uniref:Uncharacterized protein n=1 Tax=Helianthus annuus TaxID=4232 RepID=A0A9K3DMA3_HELAN|nr:hypothetical protein HanXRQr2_Chr16g0726871 [Helianthus annuus]KAJ0893779.1 hypothetical protein HanPSC8_Chr09g0381651 [Helianthus annuus]